MSTSGGRNQPLSPFYLPVSIIKNFDIAYAGTAVVFHIRILTHFQGKGTIFRRCSELACCTLTHNSSYASNLAGSFNRKGKTAMKRTDEEWLKPLTAYLKQIRLPKLYWASEPIGYQRVTARGRKAKIQQEAITEITQGVAFCHRHNLPVVASTLARNFNIADGCGCLLKRATGAANFCMALTQLGITCVTAEKIGCAHSNILEPLHSDSWGELMNSLWKATGQFFKEHGEFGVK